MNARTIAAIAAVAVLACWGLSERAIGSPPLVVALSPGYDYVTGGGYMYGEVPYAPGRAVNNSGTAIGFSTRYVSGNPVDTAAVRWDASGMSATELGRLGVAISGSGRAEPYAINDSGTAVGGSGKYESASYGFRAVRWDAGSTEPIELGILGTDYFGNTTSWAYAINNAGVAVGYCTAYEIWSNLGSRAVRWDASGAVTELDPLGTSSLSGWGQAEAYDVNEAGTAVGWSLKYTSEGSGILTTSRAVRWDAGGTAVTELGNLGTMSDGSTEAGPTRSTMRARPWGTVGSMARAFFRAIEPCAGAPAVS